MKNGWKRSKFRLSAHWKKYLLRVTKISCFWWLSCHLEHGQLQVCSSMWHPKYSPELEGKSCPLNTGSSHSLHTSSPAQVSWRYLEKKRLGVLSLANNESSRSWFRRTRRLRNKEKTEVNESVEIINEKKTQITKQSSHLSERQRTNTAAISQF